VYDTPQATREHLRRSVQLLSEAGWESRGGRLVNAQTGEPFAIEFLGDDPTDERIMKPFIDSLNRIGIRSTIRIVDTSQYVNRVRSFDYDIVTVVMSQSLSPGNEQRDFFSTTAADQPDSRNYAGIKDPVIDKLVERVI